MIAKLDIILPQEYFKGKEGELSLNLGLAQCTLITIKAKNLVELLACKKEVSG